mgnify:CR=1 FL=1|tara:strand:- start:2256 stop:2564 length:309 start_codon:yes stop_codon:yes gene_type:complete
MDDIDSSQKLVLVKEKLNSVKDVMVQTIDNVLERGEKLESLVDKTDELDSAAFQFNRNAKKLRREMLCKKIKTYLCISIIVIIFLWILSSIICGFDYKKCSS